MKCFPSRSFFLKQKYNHTSQYRTPEYSDFGIMETIDLGNRVELTAYADDLAMIAKPREQTEETDQHAVKTIIDRKDEMGLKVAVPKIENRCANRKILEVERVVALDRAVALIERTASNCTKKVRFTGLLCLIPTECPNTSDSFKQITAMLVRI
ncbi:hypothetical protein JTB14_013814 [Gonioctena quinquepunctata]|nr:hypothetical protein JTB14_013814 [Gonioctena quinquepunctata]